MSQANPIAQKRRPSRKRWLLLLGLLLLCLPCAVGGVGVLIWGVPQKLVGGGEEGKNADDIRKLSAAIANFQTKYNVDYFPSRIRLLDSGNYNLNLADNGQPENQLDYDSYLYLRRVWPRMQFPVDWNNNGKDDDAMLEGDQCLVFFLGGVQSTDGTTRKCLGFSTNGSNPAQQGGDRVAPFYEFESSRLSARPNGYFVYLDAYGKSPYAYFSAYKAANGYNRYGKTDCGSIPDGPYHDGKGEYYNRESFQIISAGADGKFGRGGKWTPANAEEIDRDGRDDVSNFHPTVLGKAK